MKVMACIRFGFRGEKYIMKQMSIIFVAPNTQSLRGNKNCDDDNGQHDPYVSAMLFGWHKKGPLKCKTVADIWK